LAPLGTSFSQDIFLYHSCFWRAHVSQDLAVHGSAKPSEFKRGRGKYGEATCVDLLKRDLPCLSPLDLNEVNFSPGIPDFEEFN
jgi:hypothetical protein